MQYSDSGSGIDPAAIHLSLDGADITTNFSIASDSAAGTLGTGAALAEGTHQLQASIADRAGNTTTASSQFVVDLTPPQAVFASPSDNSFINTSQPVLTLNYSDSLSGVDPGSVRVFLQQDTNAETEITTSFTVRDTQATGVISAAAALAEGTYHLRAELDDRAGNPPTQPVISAFVVDTTPPTCKINSPAANSYLKIAAPALDVACQDTGSGIDAQKYSVQIDGVDITAQLAGSETGISGTLAALTDGLHQLQVSGFDRAGNQAPVLTESFLVDTTPPSITVTSPASSIFTNNPHVPISVSFSDAGSGIDVTAFTLSIDGVDHTADFTVTLTGATGSPAVALSEGPRVGRLKRVVAELTLDKIMLQDVLGKKL